MSLLDRISINPVFIDEVDAIWSEAHKFIQMALEETSGEWRLEDIYNSLLSGDRALWCVYKNEAMIAAITTRIDQFPNGKRIAVIDFAGGSNWEDWNFFPDYIKSFYKALNCDTMEIAGRLGWMRLYAAKGFKPKYLVLHKEI